MSASFEPTVIIQAAQPFVLAGSQHVLAVQLLGNRLCAHSFQFSAVDRADNICCILVYHQTVFVPFVFAVAVDCITADELTFAPFHVQLAAHLDGNIPAVGIVQQILERNYNAVRIAALGVRIGIVVVDGDEANTIISKITTGNSRLYVPMLTAFLVMRKFSSENSNILTNTSLLSNQSF